MPKLGHKKKCFVCGSLYPDTPNGNDYGKYGKGGWRSCSPWCQYYERMRMI
jgi:hypothetical protein